MLEKKGVFIYIGILCIALAAVLIVLTRYVKPLKKLHPVFFILGSAAVGALFSF